MKYIFLNYLVTTVNWLCYVCKNINRIVFVYPIDINLYSMYYLYSYVLITFIESDNNETDNVVIFDVSCLFVFEKKMYLYFCQTFLSAICQ